jgi:hypothetical protein
MVQPPGTALRSSHTVVRPPQPTVADRVGQRRRLAPAKSSLPSVAACVRPFCLDCVGATSGRGAFDCGSEVCPFRSVSPFLGKPMPVTMRADDYSGEPACVAKRRPSRMIIHAQCRQCQPGDRTDCGAEDCALHAFRPWDGPGKTGKRRPSERQLAQLESARRLTPAARRHESPAQKPSTPVGAALDG